MLDVIKNELETWSRLWLSALTRLSLSDYESLIAALDVTPSE